MTNYSLHSLLIGAIFKSVPSFNGKDILGNYVFGLLRPTVGQQKTVGHDPMRENRERKNTNPEYSQEIQWQGYCP